MNADLTLQSVLEPAKGKRWLVTGAAGFIGSNLLETLLKHGFEVTAFDNYSTGHQENYQRVKEQVGDEAWSRCKMIQGDLRSLADCQQACEGASFILHQAALGSVPRSIQYPEATTDSNVTGFVNMLSSAKKAGIRRFVYASSSSVYGDEPNLPKREERMGRVLSPYALSKLINEQYADMFTRCYGMQLLGMRYFNVFGPRQSPDGAYAAVIPLWYSAMLHGEEIFINGDGETSRDFCYVANVVQANLRAAVVENDEAFNKAYNIACGERTTLNQLVACIADSIHTFSPYKDFSPKVVYRDFREGDIRHSLADISRAQSLLGYLPTHFLKDGLKEATQYYLKLSESAKA